MTTIGAIILARLDSNRLPGKGLISVRGKPILAYVLERARKIRGVNEIVLATSSRPIDDPLESFVENHGIRIFRGPLNDVAGRVLGCAREFGFDAFLRINGDSPFIDFNTISLGLGIFRSGKYDIVTNVLKRTFPIGMSVEIISTDVFARGYKKMATQEHHEHVTKYFYDNYSELSICNIESGDKNLASIHLAIDTENDLKRFRWMIDAMSGIHIDYTGTDVVSLFRRYEKQFPRAEGK